MKKLLLMLFVLMIFCSSCIDKRPNLETQLVQMCLDDMYKNKDFEYLEKPSLFLIESQYSKGLETLHFGKSKVVLKERLLSTQDAVHRPTITHEGNFFIIDDFKMDNDKANVGMQIPYMTLKISLIKKNNSWLIKEATAITDDNLLTLPPQK